MEGVMWLRGLAACCAFAASSCAAIVLASILRRRVRKAGKGGAQNVFAVSLRKGVRVFLPLSRALLSIGHLNKWASDACQVLERRGITTSVDRIVSVALAVGGGAGIVAGCAAGSVLAAIAIPVCAVAACIVAVENAQARYKQSAHDAVPAALESMSACFGSGYTLLQTFKQVASDIEGPLSATFARCASILEMGGSAEEALDELRRSSNASELAFVAVALDVQHQSGGAIRQVIDAASQAVSDELDLKRSLRVQTAQAQLSARVVALMPLALIAAFSLISPGFLSPFFESAHGMALLALAVLMQLGGIVMVRRALSVEGVS